MLAYADVQKCSQLSRYLGRQQREARRGIAESLRIFPFAMNRTWRPPGVSVAQAQQLVKLNMNGKAVADAVEALIGVLFDDAGPQRALAWLHELRPLRNLPKVCYDARHASQALLLYSLAK